MWFAKHKGKFAVGAAFALVLTLIFFLTSEAPPLRLTFLHLTNSPQGLVGVFQLENRLDESVTTAGGFYQSVADSGLEPKKGDWGAAVHLAIPANATNRFEAWIPTNTGPHRLILPWRPAGKATPRYLNGLRARSFFWLARTLGTSPSTRWRWLGWIYSVSDPFEVVPQPP